MKMSSFFQLVLALFILLNIGIAVDSTKVNEFSGPGGWIRLCKSSGSGFNNVIGTASAHKCSSGFWFQDPIKVGCVCGHGVWVFAKGWCDRTARVIVAYQGSCFSVDKEVRYIRNIGNAENAYTPYYFQTTTGFEFVQPLYQSYDFSYFNPHYDQHIGSIYRNMDIESKNSRKCLHSEDPSKKPLALKYLADKIPYHTVEECFGLPGKRSSFSYDDSFNLNDYFVAKGSSVRDIGVGSWHSDGRICNSTCTAISAVVVDVNATTVAPSNATTFLPDYYDPMLDNFYQNEIMKANYSRYHTHSRGKGPKPPVIKPKACSGERRKYSLSPKTIKEIKEQTKRMVLGHLNYALKTIQTPVVDIPEYNYFQISRAIFKTVCPDAEVSQQLLTAVLRMFRIAFKESLTYYPFTTSEDTYQDLRIANDLKTCLTNAHPFTFEYNSTVIGVDENGVEDQCPAFSKVSYTYQKGTNVTRDLYVGMPPELKIDMGKHDLPTEVAWKTVLFTHYYCSRHFKTNTTDYSYYYVRMRQLFNRWMTHRWYYPGASKKVYEYFFQMNNLKKFSENLDRCVAASRSFSHYRKWLYRPLTVKHCGGNSFEEVEDPRHNQGKSHRMLDAIAPKLTEFDNRAYCLPVWHSPVSNPGINYEPAKDISEGCVNFKKEDWLDEYTPNPEKRWKNTL